MSGVKKTINHCGKDKGLFEFLFHFVLYTYILIFYNTFVISGNTYLQKLYFKEEVTAP